ncbi:signal-regulatory protein beta-1-like [Chiloscyllium plagiosum]|uniref:signal-regulatory protein beta-1-like n=1 Tax=Chiloscyllium plagiosum TaxID=36176 RepID=UPI001CB8362D|nr:signal-regulatory protein beta-1-like [Chiloscyllium plagiosum]
MSTGNIKVLQSPAFMNVTEGSTAAMHCMYKGSNEPSVFRWFRDRKGGTELCNSTAQYRGRVIGPDREKIEGMTGAWIQLTKVTMNDQATYYCKVEFVSNSEYYGQGTTLIVKAMSAANTKVLQSPASMNITEGNTAAMHCFYEGSNGPSVFRWFRDSKGGTELCNRSAQYRGRVIGPDRQKIDGKMGAWIQLTKVTLSDQATYYCKVEFVSNSEYYGEGTTLIVTAARNQTQPSNSLGPLHIAIRVIVLALFSFTVTVIFLQHKASGPSLLMLRNNKE